MRFYDKEEIVSWPNRIEATLKNYEAGQRFFVKDLRDEIGYPDCRGGSNYIKGILAKMGFQFTMVGNKLVAWKEEKNENPNSKS